MESLFLDSWENLLRTTIVAVFAYAFLVFALRVSGKRTLSKMNAFDLIVTVALGSTLATILLSKDVTLSQGTLALLLLIAMQYVVTWASVRVRWLRKLVTGEPTLLLYRGEYLREAMLTARVTEDEVLAALRQAGLSSLQSVEAVVLETDGSMSIVLRENNMATRSALAGLPPGQATGD